MGPSVALKTAEMDKGIQRSTGTKGSIIPQLGPMPVGTL